MKKNKTDRRNFIKSSFNTLLAGAAFNPLTSFANKTTTEAGGIRDKKNILFISVDDLNDFISPLGGYDGKIHTPNFDRLAKMGVTFDNAYCTVPTCGGSRSSIMTGLLPARTKLYKQENIFAELLAGEPDTDFNQAYKNPDGSTNFTVTSLSEAMQKVGYKTYGTGKLLHLAGFYSSQDYELCSYKYPSQEIYEKLRTYYDEKSWDEYNVMDFSMPPETGQATVPGYLKPYSRYMAAGAKINTDELCKGQDFIYNVDSDYDGNESRMVDQKSVDYAIDKLLPDQNNLTISPMFLAVGLSRPHPGWLVPQKYYDMYPEQEIKIPAYGDEEVVWSKLPHIAKHSIKEETIESFKVNDEQSLADIWENTARKMYRGYLASVSFADDMLGQLLDAVEERSSTIGDKTVIILWSDHGWDLGDKLGWKHGKLWEKSSRIPFFIVDPDGAKNVHCKRVVSSLDIYPTVMDYATNGAFCNTGNGQCSYVDGNSIRKLVSNPSRVWNYGAITSVKIVGLHIGHNTDCPSNGEVDVTSHCEGGDIYTPNELDAVSHSIRTNRWRYVLHDPAAYTNNNENHTYFDELYDHVHDPKERNNLLFGTQIKKEHKQIRRMFNKILVKQLNLNASYLIGSATNGT